MNEAIWETVREHEAALTEIATSDAPDAHVARIALAIARGDKPNPDDIARLKDGSDHHGSFGSVLRAPPTEIQGQQSVEDAVKRLLGQLKRGRNP